MAIAEQELSRTVGRKSTPVRTDYYALGKEMLEEFAEKEGITYEQVIDNKTDLRSKRAVWNFLCTAEALKIDFRQVELGKILHINEQSAGKHRIKVRIAIRNQEFADT